jgi:hypothetical protein
MPLIHSKHIWRPANGRHIQDEKSSPSTFVQLTDESKVALQNFSCDSVWVWHEVAKLDAAYHPVVNQAVSAREIRYTNSLIPNQSANNEVSEFHFVATPDALQ